MFKHIYLNRLKCSIRDRQMLFWTFLFPILLSTFFGMAFSNLHNAETFNSIPVAVVDNTAYQNDAFLKSALSMATDESEGTSLFDLRILSEDAAAAALTDGEITGYFVDGETLQVIVDNNGIRQTILKVFADEYLQTRATVSSIATLNPAAMQTIGQRLAQRISLVQEQQAGSGNTDDIVIYYYALIGMACLYGGFWGLREITAVQANLSSQAARINLAPVHKIKVFAASLLAALTVQYASLLTLVAYLVFVQRISFGSQIGFIFLTCLTGSLLGIMIGALIGAISKAGQGIKTAILIGVSMLFSFFSGLMQTSIKYFVDSRLPVLHWINPANLVCDSFYALYYYDSLDRYLINTIVQAGMIVILFTAVYLILRRQRYASL